MIENSLKREKCLLVTVLICFELSFLFRFVYNFECSKLNGELSLKYLIWQNLAWLFEAVSFLALIVFHYKNFRTYPNVKRINPRNNNDNGNQNHGRLTTAVSRNTVISNLVIDESSTSIQHSDVPEQESNLLRNTSYEPK